MSFLFPGGEPQQVEIVSRVDGVTVFGYFVGVFGNAGLLMLILGGLHSTYPQVPAAGYWSTLLGYYGLCLIGSALQPTRRSWSKRRNNR